MIAKIDIPVRQVLIEARIVEADDTFGRSLGVKLGCADLRGVRGGMPGYNVGGGNHVTVGGNMQRRRCADRPGRRDDVDFAEHAVRQPAGQPARTATTPATFALSLFSAAANRFLNLELSALEADGKGKIVSSPRVITADQVKALIEQGEELPYQAATSSGATAVQFRKANLKLEVTPQITPEGNVILDVDVNKDSVGRVTAAGFAINTKHVQTQVLVENGGTVVIGGIFTQNERDDVTKVPFLGDMPYWATCSRHQDAQHRQDRTAGVPHAEGRQRPLGGRVERASSDTLSNSTRNHATTLPDCTGESMKLPRSLRLPLIATWPCGPDSPGLLRRRRR